MATTIPTEFEGEPTLTPAKIATLTDWYHEALGNYDKATDADDAAVYGGEASMIESVLRLLYGLDLDHLPDNLRPIR